MEIEQEVKKCVVRLHHQEKSHDGTGFFVSPHLILTCSHVIKNAKEQFIFVNEKKHQLKLIYCSEDQENLDLALLEIIDKNNDFNYVQLDGDLKIKDDLYSYGFPEHLKDGDPNTFQYIDIDGKGLIKFKFGNVKKGVSGSPLLNLRTKKVCGMIIKTLDQYSDLGGRAISAATILDNLPQLKSSKKSFLINPFQPTTGAIDYEKDPHSFFPRNDIIEEVFDFLNGGSGIALMGETGSGKSSLLKVIKSQTYTLLNNKRKPIILDLGQISNNQEYYKLLCELCEIDPPVEGYEFVKSLKAIKKEKYGFLLLIDNVEQMIWDGFTYDLRNQLRSLANDVDPPLQLVIATNQSLTQLFQDSGKDSPFEGICLNVEVPCGDEDTMKRFIETRLAKTSVKFTENEIHNLMQKSKGNPRKLMQLCYTQFLHHSKIPHRNEFRRS